MTERQKEISNVLDSFVYQYTTNSMDMNIEEFLEFFKEENNLLNNETEDFTIQLERQHHKNLSKL